MSSCIETEVYRITPEKGKYYETAIYTRKVGRWPNEKYYTTKPLRYVGEFIKHHQTGYGDGAQHWDIYMNNGKEERVDYEYEGTTCFREVSKRGLPKSIKEELIKKHQENLMKNPTSLESLAKNALSTLDIKNARIFL